MSAPRRRTWVLQDPKTLVIAGDCRDVLLRRRRFRADLVFADPPFNLGRAYSDWHDVLSRSEYLQFTDEWLDRCIDVLRPGGALWVNLPDDWVVEVVIRLMDRGLEMVNWCIWHFRFGQHTRERFIPSKAHALYFIKPGGMRTWNESAILEPSDRASKYADPRTQSKSDGAPGKRVPLDVWYGQNWGRVQGNNKERRPMHDNQLPEVYLERIIRACTNSDDLVLDPFLGSGTTGVVARALGRRFIGIDISRRYARSAYTRIKSGSVRIHTGRGSSH